MKLNCLLCAAGSLWLCACTTTSNHHVNNTENLKGTWTCLSATVEGKALPKETTELLGLTLTENRYKTEKGSEVLFDSSYTIDPSEDPKQINMVGTEGDIAGKEAPGIYSLEKDILRICYVMPGLPRPKEFQSQAGSKTYLVSWKRKSP